MNRSCLVRLYCNSISVCELALRTRVLEAWNPYKLGIEGALSYLFKYLMLSLIVREVYSV